MLFPYFVGLFLGIQIGKGFERTNNKYYQHTEKIIKLEKKVKEYICRISNVKTEDTTPIVCIVCSRMVRNDYTAKPPR